MPKSEVLNMDCMEGMKQWSDKHFELAIVDPPYGIGNIIRHAKGGNQMADNFHFDDGKDMSWNDEIPSDEYFSELQRVSKNQIIWGGNYYASKLQDSRCWIVWDKQNGGSSFADAELAWTSFDKIVDLFRYTWHGMIQGNMSNKEKRIHPTQKPIALYKWLLKNYAKEGDKILDTHLGSGSSRIAAYDMGFDFTGYELDKDYFDASVKRFEQYKAQLKLFA